MRACGSFQPYKCYLDPGSGRPVQPFIPLLMGPRGEGIPFLAYVPSVPWRIEPAETRVLNVNTAALPWYQDATKIPFERLPRSAWDLVFTLQAKSDTVRSQSASVHIK